MGGNSDSTRLVAGKDTNNLSGLNTCRLILDAVGEAALRRIADDFIGLVGSSCAVYERNGDYALGIFSSGWCQMMDAASFQLCGTDDLKQALESGRWLCHEACWCDASLRAIEQNSAVDVGCHGGIRLYAVPIRAGGEVVGCINFGYGDPPLDPVVQGRLADLFRLPTSELQEMAQRHPVCSPEQLTEARRRLKNAANLIGLMVERHQAQELARDAVRRYQLLFETMAQGVVFFDTHGQVLEANPAALRILDHSFDELTLEFARRSETTVDVSGQPIPMDELPTVKALRERRMVSGQTIGHTHSRSGKVIWICGDVVPVFDADNSDAGVLLSIFSDVTEQKQAQDELRVSERFRQRVSEVLPNILYVFDLPTRSNSYVSRRVTSLLGYTQEQVVSLGAEFVSEVMHQEDLARFDAHLAEIVELADGETLDFEYRMRALDGQWHWFSSRVGVFQRDANGAVTQVLGTVTDYTERKKAEIAQRESEARLSVVFNCSCDLLLLVSVEPNDVFKVAAVNQRYLDRLLDLGLSLDRKRLVGLTLEQMATDVLGLDSSVADYTREHYRRAIQTGEPVCYEESFDFEKGPYHSEVTLVPVKAEDGSCNYVLFSSHDITQRKLAELERQQAEQHMRQVQKLESLGVLTGGIAHDFNNLLVAILGNADLAIDSMEQGNSEASGFVGDIKVAAQRAADLCQQMLAYAGKGRFVLERIDLSKLVEEMGHILKISMSKKATLHYKLKDSLPAVLADAAQLRQVVMNLITNASDAVGDTEGIVAVRTGTVKCTQDDLMALSTGVELAAGDYVYAEVTDSGVGMDATTRERIFDPFFSTKFAGRGLGLAATLGIVRGHKGAIEVRSELGEGTTIRVMLPAATAEPAPTRIAATPRTEWTGQGCILVVDDEPSVRKIAARMLHRLGFDVLEAEDGLMAIEVFRANVERVVAVLLDLTMPKIDGEDALRALRDIRSDVTVILSSGYSEHEVSARLLGKGYVGFMQKPYSMAEMREVLQRFLKPN